MKIVATHGDITTLAVDTIVRRCTTGSTPTPWSSNHSHQQPAHPLGSSLERNELMVTAGAWAPAATIASTC